MSNRESISEIDIARLYGKENLDLAQLFMTNGEIISPFGYKAFVELLSWRVMQSMEEKTYRSVLKTYSDDCRERFAKTNEFINTLSFRGFTPGFAASILVNPRISNLYDTHFQENESGAFFRKESDLEYLLYDNLHWFDLNESVKVSRQFATTSGPVDLLIEHDCQYFLTELKRKAARRKDVYQAADYAKGVDFKAHAVLIAHSFGENALALAKELNVACYEYRIGLGLPDTMLFLEPVIENKQFSSLYRYILEQTGDIVGHVPGLNKSVSDKYKEILKRYNATVKWLLNEIEHLTA